MKKGSNFFKRQVLKYRNENFSCWWHNPSHGKIKGKFFLTTVVVQETRLNDVTLVLHAFKGSSRRPPFSRKRKIKFFKLFQQCEAVHKFANVFNNRETDYDAVQEEENWLFWDYIEHPLQLHVLIFSDTTLLKNLYRKPNLRFDPFREQKERRDRQHSFQVYHQVQLWLDWEQQAELWSCKLRQKLLITIKTKNSITNGAVLNAIFWKWATGYEAKYGSRKAAMNSAIVCNICHASV